MTNVQRANYVAHMNTNNEKGIHFSRNYSQQILDDLERAGYITIYRPIHEPSGIPYDQQYWTVEVTKAGVDFVDLYYDVLNDNFNDLRKNWA